MFLPVSACFVLTVALRVTAISQSDLFHYPRQTFCLGGPCLDLVDDGSLTVNTKPFPFFGRLEDSLEASINGIIYFGGSIEKYRNQNLSDSVTLPAIAVFYHDADLSFSGMLYHLSTTNQTTFQRVHQLIQQGFVDAADFEAQEIIVTTYYRVGYFQRQHDRLNTYQSVIATDYKRTFLLLLYVDIEWNDIQPYNRSAQVGMYTGDRKTFYELPYSDTLNITKLTNFTNIGIPGMSLYQISGHTIEPGGCSSTDSYPIRMYPRYGSELGGTLVRLQGYCFSSGDTIEAEFGSRRVRCAYRSELVALCVVPQLPNPRTLAVKLLVNGEVKGQTSYTTLSADSSYGINLVGTQQTSSPVFLTVSERVSLTYNPSDLFPGEIPGSFLVDILLYGMNLDTGEWVELRKLSEGVVNTGSMTVILPGTIEGGDIRPIALFIGSSLATGTAEPPPNLAALQSAQLRAGVFTPIYYIGNRAALNGSGRSLCDQWYNMSSNVTGDIGCPAIVTQAQLPTSGLSLMNLTSVMGKDGYTSNWITTFHSGANVCYQQALVLDQSATGPPTQQVCCYDNKGQLLEGSPNGSAVSVVAREYDGRRHFLEDVRPYLLCCATDAPSCKNFYQRRASSREVGQLPIQPAWVVGDPHFITFDGSRYTFNGYGEFTLLQTDSGDFRVQGRMEPLLLNQSGTILTAIAVNYNGDRINILTNVAGENAGGLDVYLNDTHITPDYLTRMPFRTFTLSYNTSRTLHVLFLNGVHLDCQTSDGNITQFLVGVPKSLKGRVSGLLGTYDDDMTDDLSPLTSSGTLGIPLTEQVNLQTLHQQFGLSWIVTSESDSAFQYFANETFLTSKDDSFSPPFQVSDEDLSRCKGDFFCAYDAAVTNDINFGLHTLASVEEAVRVKMISKYAPCVPACSAGGECQPNNECVCYPGFTGSRCEINIVENCNSTELCPPPSVCILEGTSYSCRCPDGKTGRDCATATTSAAGGAISTVSIAIIGVGGLVFILGILIPVIIIVIVVMVCKKRNAEEVKEHREAVGDYSTTNFDMKLNTMDRKTSTLSLPPAYSDLALDDRNGIQLTKCVSNGGKPVDTIPENEPDAASDEPEYAAISDSNYQNVPGNSRLQQRRCSESVITGQPGPLPQQGQPLKQVHNGGMQTSSRAQSHTVITISPGSNSSGSETKAIFPSSSSGNVAARASSQCSLGDRPNQPWYRSSTPSVAGAEAGAVPNARQTSTSPSHLSIPSPTAGMNGSGPVPSDKSSTLPFSHSQPTANQYTPDPTCSSMSVQSIPANSSHKPLRANHSNPGSGNVRVSSRQSNTLNRSIPELLKDSSLPASDV